MLDVIPSDRYFINRRTIGVGGEYCSGTIDPCLFNIPTNNHRVDNKLSVNYMLGGVVPNIPSPVFDINTKNSCTGFMSPIFYVNEFKQFGFGTNQPASTYHFATPSFQIGSSNTTMFKVADDEIRFSNGKNELFKVTGTGLVYARRIKVTTANPFPDYVFDNDYKLMPLSDLNTYLKTNKHLPNINSAAEYAKEDGVDIGELQLKMLEKIEELTLYILQQEKRIAELEKVTSK